MTRNDGVLLTFDVGNTETTVGVFEGDVLRTQWRLTTGTPRTADELGLVLGQLMGGEAESVRAVAIGSVVPPMTPVLAAACARRFGVDPLIVDARSPLPITLAVDEPATVGADRVLNTLAASRIYGRDAIVVDLGTATTYDCITAAGAFLGGVIQPGVLTSSENLIRRTAQLTATALAAPERVIGRNTADCIRSGVVLGAADAIDGLIRRIKREWPEAGVTPYVIATGGLGETFRGICAEIDDVDPGLTLRGLQIAYGILRSV